MFIETRGSSKNKKYYLVHSYRAGDKVKRVSRYLGSKLSEKELERFKSRAEQITRIMEINRLVMFSLHANAGKYKKSQNKIQGNPDFKTANPREVPLLMHELCSDIAEIQSRKQCIERIGFVHNQMQRIHPFSDGNSRTTRMLMNWLLIKFRFPILVIRMGSFDEYMSLTKISKKRDDEELNQLFMEMIFHEQLVNS